MNNQKIKKHGAQKAGFYINRGFNCLTFSLKKHLPLPHQSDHNPFRQTFFGI